MGSMIRFSMKNTVAVLLIIMVLIGGGLYAAGNMKMEMYPDVDIPYMHVNIIYPGASPEQSMRDIGEPLEKALANIDGVNNIYTWGSPNRFQAVLKTDMSASMDEVEQEVRDTLAKTKLPDTAQEPMIMREKMDPEVYVVAFSGPDQDLLQQFIEETAAPAIRSVEGVDSIEMNGVLDKRVYIRVKPEALDLHWTWFNSLLLRIIYQSPLATCARSNKYCRCVLARRCSLSMIFRTFEYP